MGKVESGTVAPGMDVLLFPLSKPASVDKVLIEDAEVPFATPGENVKIKLKGVGEEDVHKGCVAMMMMMMTGMSAFLRNQPAAPLVLPSRLASSPACLRTGLAGAVDGSNPFSSSPRCMSRYVFA